jgi:predicted DCC family thiol-disulfide oxidoreductase YuxK
MLSARLRLCMILGTGRQWMSWIHIADVTQLICACIEREELRGPINATAPMPVRQKEFAETLAQCFGRALPVPVSEQMLRWGLGEMSQLLLDGQRVLPVKAHCAGLEFEFSNLTAALHDLVARASPAEPAEILYDSLCPVCDVEMNAYCRAAQRVGFRWRFADVAARMELMTRYRLDLATARKRVYMLNDAGEMLSGIDALASIWMALPRWRVVARIVRLPLIRPLAAGFYDRVLAPLIWRWNARRRRSLQGEPASW